MPRPRSAMRKVREVLRLTLGERLTRHQVAAALGMPPTTVTDYVSRALAAGLRWPLPEGLDDAELEARLFVQAATLQVLRVTAPAPLPGAVRVGLITTYYNTRICRPRRTDGGAAVDPHVARASRLIRSSWGTPIWPNQMRLSRHPPSTERAHAAIRCTLVVPPLLGDEVASARCLIASPPPAKAARPSSGARVVSPKRADQPSGATGSRS
jgi:hypothetical protein